MVQLNPDAPKDGINKREFYQQKFGGRTSGLISNMTVRSLLFLLLQL